MSTLITDIMETWRSSACRAEERAERDHSREIKLGGSCSEAQSSWLACVVPRARPRCSWCSWR
eukprot:1704953-Alexandrium_andersonii.AAC.1